MGTLHQVYQLKPKVLTYGAILRVLKDQENLFLEKYMINKNLYHKGQDIFPNIFITNSNNRKVRRYALYATERIIDFEESGIYVSIQDGSKSGFYDFEKYVNEMSPYLENALFYVIWDSIITRYEIKDRKLYCETTQNFDRWNYKFCEYITANYTSQKQLITDFYVEEINELILFHNELIGYGDNPNDYYDPEDYEDLLNKINNYKEYISLEKFTELENWLKIQIDYYN